MAKRWSTPSRAQLRSGTSSAPRGVLFSGKMLDQCGVCDGDGLSCAGCDGTPDGRLLIDKCGVCGGSDSLCVGCDGVLWSQARLDKCGKCAGLNECMDCTGLPWGQTKIDRCMVCAGSDECVDCSGIPFGSHQFDRCGVCGGTGQCVPAEVCLGDSFLMFMGSSFNCSCPAVTCDARGSIVGVTVLPPLRLNGTIPPSIILLTSLRTMDVGSQLLSGSIPDVLSDLRFLCELVLSSNRLGGDLPKSLGQLLSLQRLALDNNAFTGSLDVLRTATNLRFVNISSNKFSGSVATVFSSLHSLELLDARSNLLSGDMGLMMSQMALGQRPGPGLQSLNLASNFISGRFLPEAWSGPGGNSNLWNSLVLDNNRLSGTLSSGIAALSGLERLSMASNGLFGTIPAEISSISVLSFLDLSQNSFLGAVPERLESLQYLHALSLHNNLLSKLPSLSRLSKLQSLLLHSNRCPSALLTTSSTQLTGSLILIVRLALCQV